MIPLKSDAEIEAIRQSCLRLAKIMRKIKDSIKEGISTNEINALAEALIAEEKVLPAFKGYHGYPATICVSLNEEVVHGIPGENRLSAGDILSLDLGLKYNNYFSDMAITLPVGNVDPGKQKLIDGAKKALELGIEQAVAGNHLFDISYAIQHYVESEGFSVVRQFVGHGIGKQLHEEPEIPNFGRPHHGPLLRPGMVLAIEPMVNMGGWEVKIKPDGWTAVTKDGLPSAHFEHTVAITQHGPEVLTN